MTGTQFREMVKEAEAKRATAKKAYNDYWDIAREGKKAEKEVMTAKARLFSSITSPMTARQISNLVGGAISKYSVAMYFMANENRDRIGGYCNSVYTPNGKKLRKKTIKKPVRYALLDDNGNPTSTEITVNKKYTVYWAE
jgi:hypothetical protein